MRRKLTTAALLFGILALTLTSSTLAPTSTATKQTCSECQFKVNQRFEQCVAVHGNDYLRCFDDFNEGIVHCFAHFCEIESRPTGK